MERKLGEIFEYNGEWYQAVEQPEKSCKDCYFYSDDGCLKISTGLGWCRHYSRNDNKSIIFKKLEKIGEPLPCYYPSGRIVYFQKYKLFDKSYSHNTEYIMCDFNEDGFVSIGFRQTKKDMKEKKLNLKPFDLEKAKAGKPVCTRDGRKARIICFDLKNDEYPIVAAVGNDSSETLFSYTTNGEIADGIESDKDLMMLTEKKEGWIIFTKEMIHPTKESAERFARSITSKLGICKVEWEE